MPHSFSLGILGQRDTMSLGGGGRGEEKKNPHCHFLIECTCYSSCFGAGQIVEVPASASAVASKDETKSRAGTEAAPTDQRRRTPLIGPMKCAFRFPDVFLPSWLRTRRLVPLASLPLEAPGLASHGDSPLPLPLPPPPPPQTPNSPNDKG